ncbi:hypothetical protein [Haloarcula onubensis]|uniref:Sulfatase N-terminal domain-containing protein n=1 Tax=Haloarcula onubensis TaxID=2950539 RepID=A0ABU2FNE6_9EURY|nr:hypothetical protein [Halomicroarcula sp. S3CR25-11]MDS0282282.1 hypothetical protein [Halomicroarcula sp. S3CR25-11]
MGSASREFILNNFGDKQLHDTIYVTANSHFEQLDDDVFFYVERVYGDVTVDGRQETNRRLLEATVELHQTYPNKRIITHFMQPHAPYISERAAELREQIASESKFSFSLDDGSQSHSDSLLEFHSLLTARRFGFLSDRVLREVYQYDFEHILGYVESLIDELDGKTVLTADHGELLGERLPPLYLRDWGHGYNLFSKPVRTVPWFVVDHEERRDIQTDKPLQSEGVREEDVRKHLELLGYK